MERWGYHQSHCLPGVKRLQPCRLNFCWSPVSFLEPVQPLTWQKIGKVLDQNYESMIIFLRPFLFPPIQWCTFTKNSFFLTQMLLWVRIQVSLRSYLVTFWSMIKNIFTRKDKNTHKNYLQYTVLTNMDKKATLSPLVPRFSPLNYRSGCIQMKTSVFYFDFHL